MCVSTAQAVANQRNGITFGATTRHIMSMRDHLAAQRVTCVVMEATSEYWNVYYELEDLSGVEVMLVNARHVKNLPGRKTDVADATWLAQFGAHGLVRGVDPHLTSGSCGTDRTRTAVLAKHPGDPAVGEAA